MNYLAALIVAPIVGMDPDDTRTLHAVTSHAINDITADGWASAELIPAACGVDVKLLAHPNGAPVSWPIPTALVPTLRRCPACRRVCGGRYDRRWWGKPAEAAGLVLAHALSEAS